MQFTTTSNTSFYVAKCDIVAVENIEKLGIMTLILAHGHCVSVKNEHLDEILEFINRRR